MSSRTSCNQRVSFVTLRFPFSTPLYRFTKFNNVACIEATL